MTRAPYADGNGRRVPKFGRIWPWPVAVAAVAFVVTLIAAGRPWYKYGSDGFTAQRNGWNTCPALLGTHSYELWFVGIAAIATVFAAAAHHAGRRRWVGAAAATVVAVFGSLYALRQLDRASTGEICSGYNYEVLPAAKISTFAMIIVLVAVAVSALGAALRPSRSLRPSGRYAVNDLVPPPARSRSADGPS